MKEHLFARLCASVSLCLCVYYYRVLVLNSLLFIIPWLLEFL
jgi:hypothetical protein